MFLLQWHTDKDIHYRSFSFDTTEQDSTNAETPKASSR
jgi:hypothetical protein